MEEKAGPQLTPVESFIEFTRTELDKTRTGLKEIGLLIEQSQGEVDKLAQRNATITVQLHQLQAQFETVPREDIRSTYESSQDAQQRLFTMRGQLEKLQSDQVHLRRYGEYLSRTLSLLEGGPAVEIGDQAGVVSPGIEHIIEAQEEERRKISRQIHDGPAQALSNFILQTEIALRLFDVDPGRAREELTNLKAAASSTFSHVRDFIFDLRPMMLDDLGLVPTVRRYTQAVKDKTGLDIGLVITGTERRLATHREVLVFRGIQELLANVRDHAQATQVKILVYLDDDQVRVSVEDNGKGVHSEGLSGENGRISALSSLEERIGLVGGTFQVESPSDKGLRVSFTIPTGE